VVRQAKSWQAKEARDSAAADKCVRFGEMGASSSQPDDASSSQPVDVEAGQAGAPDATWLAGYAEAAQPPRPRKHVTQKHDKDEAMGQRVKDFEQRRPDFDEDEWQWGANMLHSLERDKTSKDMLAQAKLRKVPGGIHSAGNRRMLPASSQRALAVMAASKKSGVGSRLSSAGAGSSETVPLRAGYTDSSDDSGAGVVRARTHTHGAHAHAHAHGVHAYS